MISNLISNLILFPKNRRMISDMIWYDISIYFPLPYVIVFRMDSERMWKAQCHQVWDPRTEDPVLSLEPVEGETPADCWNRGLWELLQRRGALHCGRTALDGRCVEISDVGSQKNWATTVKWCKMCWNHLKSGNLGSIFWLRLLHFGCCWTRPFRIRQWGCEDFWFARCLSSWTIRTPDHGHPNLAPSGSVAEADQYLEMGHQRSQWSLPPAVCWKLSGDIWCHMDPIYIIYTSIYIWFMINYTS